MPYHEGFHVVRDEDWSPNLFPIPESATVYKFGIRGNELACDGGIGEVDDRLTYQPAVPRALRPLTPLQAKFVLKEFGFDDGIRLPIMSPAETSRELASAMRSMKHVLNATSRQARTHTGTPWYEGIQNTNCILPSAQK